MLDLQEKNLLTNPRKLQIASLALDNPVLAAPLAGYTDKAFRRIAGEFGCALSFTEMISAQALTYNSGKTLNLMDLSGEIYPVGIQLFGSDPQIMGEAARYAQAAGAAVIDLNFGCPTPKITNNGEGSALMRDLSRAGQIMEQVVRAVQIPVTVKMRKGWDENQVTAPELAYIAENSGIAGITLHGRTRMQFYAGQADWQIIRQVQQRVKIPVIGNGDIWEPADAQRMLQETGCAGVMLGRGALGNPWLFSRTIALLTQGTILPAPTLTERITLAKQHIQLEVALKGEFSGIREMRKHLVWYVKGYPGAARIREAINRAASLGEILAALDAFHQDNSLS